MGQRNYQPKYRRAKTGHREINLERDKRQNLYRGNDEWRKFSYSFLKVNPDCYVCGVKATVVDHIIPHKGDKKLFEQIGNHLPLCVEHHNYVTTKFDRDYRVGASVDPKKAWLNEERMRNEILQNIKFPKVKMVKYRGD